VKDQGRRRVFWELGEFQDEGWRWKQRRGELKMDDIEWKVLKCGKNCSRWERSVLSDFVVCVLARYYQIHNCIPKVRGYLQCL